MEVGRCSHPSSCFQREKPSAGGILLALLLLGRSSLQGSWYKYCQGPQRSPLHTNNPRYWCCLLRCARGRGTPICCQHTTVRPPRAERKQCSRCNAKGKLQEVTFDRRGNSCRLRREHSLLMPRVRGNQEHTHTCSRRQCPCVKQSWSDKLLRLDPGSLFLARLLLVHYRAHSETQD